MWSAESLDQILLRARKATQEAVSNGGPSQRIVSMVFAPPEAKLGEVIDFPYVNGVARSAWDLFFVGAPGVARGDESAPAEGVPMWSGPTVMNWDRFGEIADQVHRRHASALKAHGRQRVQPWKYSGASELVSLFARDGDPDWLTLRAVAIEASAVNALVPRMVPGVDGSVDPRFSPRIPPRGVVGRPGLENALHLTARLMLEWAAAGVIGNSVFAGVHGLL